jgi:hypothetical protein
MSQEPSVDPRFPAAFQRGYAGGGEAAPQGFSVIREEITPPPPAPAPAPESAPSVNTLFEATATGDPTDADAHEPRANPFVVLLWVVSLGLTLGGLFVTVWSQSRMYGGFTGPSVPTDFLISQVAYSMASPSIQAGLFGIIGLLFWHAAAWRRRSIAARSQH